MKDTRWNQAVVKVERNWHIILLLVLKVLLFPRGSRMWFFGRMPSHPTLPHTFATRSSRFCRGTFLWLFFAHSDSVMKPWLWSHAFLWMQFMQPYLGRISACTCDLSALLHEEQPCHRSWRPKTWWQGWALLARGCAKDPHHASREVSWWRRGFIWRSSHHQSIWWWCWRGVSHLWSPMHAGQCSYLYIYIFFMSLGISLACSSV